MKYYLGVEKYFGVAIVAPPVNHILPTILGGNGLPRYSLPGCTSILFYYYIAATLWVITSGNASTTIRVLLSALRNIVRDLLLVSYYSYYLSCLAKIPLYLTTLRPAFHNGYIAFQ